MGLLGTLIPLVILGAFVGGFAWIGYEVWLYLRKLVSGG